ncbi:MAG: VanZ family protein [Oscillospiraceae bacterium]|nr:VanZ family protein [Oscillospiraceae bacterium]
MADLFPNTVRTLRGALLPSLPWAALFLLLGLLFLRRRRRPLQVALPRLGALCLYAAMLLYGTVFSRVSSAADFFRLRLAETPPYFVWHFAPALPLSQLHFASNILLFLPFGLFACAADTGRRPLLRSTLAGAAASCCIELFQLLHGSCFDFGDLVANTAGTALGAALFLALQLLYRKAVKKKA